MNTCNPIPMAESRLQDIYTNTATPHDSGVVLFFPSAFQHMDLAGDPAPHNDGLVDIRFGSARSVRRVSAGLSFILAALSLDVRGRAWARGAAFSWCPICGLKLADLVLV